MKRRRRRVEEEDEGRQATIPTDSGMRARPEPAVDNTAAELVRRTFVEPSEAVAQLESVDTATQGRAITVLQRERGNAYVQQVVQGLAARQAGFSQAPTHGGTGAGAGRGETITLERDEEEPEPVDATDEVEQLADIPEGATEEVGPTTSSSYAVAATSLSDVASQLASRDEAGYCGWKEAWNFKTGPTGRITAVKVTVKIDIEMPAWTPPPSMLPKTKAEWERSYQALLAHERGHEKLVHDYFDGLANKILGKTGRQGRQLFDGAKSGLAAASKAYDAKTGNGTKTGTIIDTTIEQRELDEKKKEEDEKRKKAAAEKAGRKAEAEAEGGEPAETPA